MAQKQVTITAIIEFDETEMSEDELTSSLVICFWEEDKTGTELFLPKTENSRVVEYMEIKCE